MGDATYHDDYKNLEQVYMVLKDQYAELAVAVGASPMAVWGDPQEKHEEIVAMAKVLQSPPDEGLGHPVRPFLETFSAEEVIMSTFFPGDETMANLHEAIDSWLDTATSITGKTIESFLNSIGYIITPK